MTYTIEIIETLSEVVDVEAKTLDEALGFARGMYDEEEIVLDATNFVGVSITGKQA